MFVGIVQGVLDDVVKQFNEQRHPAVSLGKQPQPAKRTKASVSVMASEPVVTDAVPDANVGEFSAANCNFSQYLSSDSRLSFSLDDCGDIAGFDCDLLPVPLPQFDQTTGFPTDSAYVSLESSPGSPASFKGY